MMIRPISFVLILGLAGPAFSQETFTRLEPTPTELEQSLRTDWYGVYLQGKKIGYFKTSRELARGDDPVIRDSIELHLKLASFGKKITMSIVQSLDFSAKAPYELLRGSYKEDAGGIGPKADIKRTGKGTFDVVITEGGVARKKTVEGLDYTFSDGITTELWLRRKPAIGNEITVRDLQLKEQKVESQKTKLVREKKSLINGVDVTFFEVDAESTQDKIKIESKHDAALGRMISGQIARIFELRLEPEDKAKDTEHSEDLFVLGTARINRPLGKLTQVDELVLEVQGAPDAFADGPRQSIVKDAKGSMLLRTGKRYGVPAKATKDDIAENLKETAAFDLSHPKVKALATLAAGNAKTDAEKVKNITAFVQRYIEPRLGNNLPTIHDLIERRQGDCKSYALLFTTLARANGVPARSIAGLVYTGDDTKGFGGHAWNEVVLDGVWVPIDCTLNETEINATHLSFGTEKVAAKNLLETMGTLKLRVVEVKTK